ncbi:MAG: ABC transporter permease [Chloroflexota bacterium]|nr:ABC transporter permease [Chloroflexota bacterium]
MASFVVRRLLQLVVTIWGALTVVFVLMHLAGDPTHLMVSDLATPQQIAQLRAELGLDKPPLVQYGIYLARTLHGDFGMSIREGQPVTVLVLHRLPYTLELALAAVILSTLFGIVFGVLGAITRGTIYDRVLLVLALLGQSVPTVWLGILLILMFAVVFRIMPASGAGDLKHLVLPAVSLGTFSLARTARIARSSMIDVLNQDYVRTARAKGLREFVVVNRHAIKNASISVVTVIGFTFATLIGGAIITEAIFAWPGIGSLIVDAVSLRDFPLVQGAVFATAVLVAVTMLLIDFTYRFLDPRITFEAK